MARAEDQEWVIFPSRVEKKWRVWIPRHVRELLNLREGDYLEVAVRRLKRYGLLRE